MVPEEIFTLPDKEHLTEVSRMLASAKTKGQLGTMLAEVTGEYSRADLQILGGRLYAEVNSLPNPYREQIRPFFMEQLFGAYHALLFMHRSGTFASMNEPVTDPETFGRFCRMIPDGCVAGDEHAQRTPFPYSPRHRLFYYLMSAFTMFVLDHPGHPVGMPFPGGFKVEDRNGTFYCLIRDREKEVFFSICNFCPARQTEDTSPVHSR